MPWTGAMLALIGPGLVAGHPLPPPPPDSMARTTMRYSRTRSDGPGPR